jgi:dihydroxyacetone kinase-like protein
MADTVDIGAFSEWMRAFAATVHDNAQYLTELDAAIGDADHGSNLDRGMKAVVAALDAGSFDATVDGIIARGKAEAGDKTMVDAWLPALEAYDDAVAGGLASALSAAATAAAKGRDETIPLVARKGRASYLGERSAGHQDPGATSTTMLLESAVASLS